jgi:hypothetical protein
MKVYLWKDIQHTAQHVTATRATVTQLTSKIEGRGHKLYMDNLFLSPELFDDLVTKQIYGCTVRPNRKGMSKDLKPKTSKLKRGDIRGRTHTGGPKGKDDELSHINDCSRPVSVFLLYYAEIITLLVVQNNRYYHDYTERLDNGLPPQT